MNICMDVSSVYLQSSYRMILCAGFDKDKDRVDAFSKNCVF